MISLAVAAAGWVGVGSPGDYAARQFLPLPRHDRTFFGYSIAGYGIALLVSLYVLWTFGRLDGLGAGQIAMMTAVLGFPSAIGAALARLIV